MKNVEEAYDEIFAEDMEVKGRARKKYKSNIKNIKKDREHGKAPEPTRKQLDQGEYFFAQRGKRRIAVRKKENGKKKAEMQAFDHTEEE